MAHRPSQHVVIILLLLAMAIIPSFSLCPLQLACENELIWRIYLKQVGAGQFSNQKEIVSPASPPFGITVVNDWVLLDAPNPNATVLGRAQGIHVLSDLTSQGWYASLNIVFQGNSRFSGSTLQVMGVLPPAGEWAIVGGTGQLALARGTIKHKIAATAPDTNFRQLDIHALYAKSFS